uniref:Uncharacterized protein n=1 Tax=Anopheles maculatus TaxID=74869 RepID=A0A182SFK1_9DIPT
MDGGSITKQSLTGTSVTSTNDISLTSYDRTCDIFRLQASGAHQSSRDLPPTGTASAVLMLDQLAAQLSDEELSSYGAAVELMLDDDDDALGVAGNDNSDHLPARTMIDKEAGDNVSAEHDELEEEPMLLEAVPDAMHNGPQQQQTIIDEEDEDELTEKQLSF